MTDTQLEITDLLWVVDPRTGERLTPHRDELVAQLQAGANGGPPASSPGSTSTTPPRSTP